ncbi:hypothetical protein MKJ01_16555 [Chryseobacterium sp. SSA4.19]|uniref:hypothetical protein n=1 Tax=Chryseobacterium sp. SSA4.19 TaxID=2919915 RepID=UPI001F4ED474|nr:hypothetical protein [Chryseobacterium sp. SSA4.19]MCJ8155378.1 hypothetical protein [Chryseobacterium sp. SSA4.19]
MAYCQKLFEKHRLKFIISKQQYTDGHLTTSWIVTGKSVRHEALMKDLMEDEKITGYQF